MKLRFLEQQINAKQLENKSLAALFYWREKKNVKGK